MAEKKISVLLVLGQEYIRHDERNFVRNMILREEFEKEELLGEPLSRRNFHDNIKIAFADENVDEEIRRNANVSYSVEMNSFFESISNCYIPLLNMFSTLEKERVPFNISLVITPVLCSLLSDAVVKKQYIAWLDEKITLGNKELERCASDKILFENAKLALEKAEEAKMYFTEIYLQDLLKAFSDWQRKGFVELLATTGTSLFLPHFADMTEVLNAQVETGLKSHRYFFGESPSGFWLPKMGYSRGIEKVLRSYGVEYTVLDSQSVLFSDSEPKCGIFAPLAFDNSIGIIARASEIDDLIFSDGGYIHHGAYRAKTRDIGFYLESDNLLPLVRQGSARFTTGYGYWNKSRIVSDVNSIGDPKGSDVYDVDKAMEQCSQDAENFVAFVAEKLCAAEKKLPEEEQLSLLCTFDMETLSEHWDECISWIEYVLKNIPQKSLESKSCLNVFLENQNAQKIAPYYGACCGGGYGENLISGKNSWMIRYLRKASERMVDLTERFPDDAGIKARLLNLGAKELMLAQSCGWQQMIDDGKFAEYAEKQFSLFILSFTSVFEALGSNSVSTEWITQMEYRHPLFPWMNYRIFSKKR